MNTHNAVEKFEVRHSPTDVNRVRDGLQIAMDGLTFSERDSYFRRIMLAMDMLVGTLSQKDKAANAADILESAESLAEYYGGPADEINCDAAYDEWREG